MAIQYHIRRLRRGVRDASALVVQNLRLALIPLVAKLRELQEAAGAHLQQTRRQIRRHSVAHPRPTPVNSIGEVSAPQAAAAATVNLPEDLPTATQTSTSTPPAPLDARSCPEDLIYWDNLNGIDEDADSVDINSRNVDAAATEDIPPEHIVLVLPSNGNTSAHFKNSELAIRRKAADSLLNQIRDVIADKSFRYTDHIRTAPRKGVKTRARTTILELDRHLSLFCQLYTYCRARMQALGADEQILNHFQPLKKEDVRSSTAVLRPNQAGSTKLKLSWIWQSMDRRIMADPNEGLDTSDPATLLECELMIFRGILTLNICPAVRRIHWLRGRASAQRWAEETMLVPYEMQWTVRYFMHKSNFWDSELCRGTTLTAGARAYAERKKMMWRHMAEFADKEFKLNTAHYVSPIAVDR